MSYISASSIDELDIIHGFFTREEGVSKGEFSSRNVKNDIGDQDKLVYENRQRCLAELQLTDHPLVYAKLCHGKSIYVVNGDQKTAEVDQYDAIISAVPYVNIGLSTADCIPILIADKKKRAVAIVHAGWRGLQKEIIQETINELERLYSIPSDELVVAIGPAIHQANYEVGREVASQFDPGFTSQIGDSLHLDLIAITQSQLATAGVKDVELQAPDVFIDERFYSYRRDSGKTGRQLSVICLTP